MLLENHYYGNEKASRRLEENPCRTYPADPLIPTLPVCEFTDSLKFMCNPNRCWLCVGVRHGQSAERFGFGCLAPPLRLPWKEAALTRLLASAFVNKRPSRDLFSVAVFAGFALFLGDFVVCSGPSTCSSAGRLCCARWRQWGSSRAEFRSEDTLRAGVCGVIDQQPGACRKGRRKSAHQDVRLLWKMLERLTELFGKAAKRVDGGDDSCWKLSWTALL